MLHTLLTPSRLAVGTINRCLATCITGLTMLTMPVAAWSAAPVAPKETQATGPGALPYGSGYERRQLTQDGLLPATPAAATSSQPAASSPTHRVGASTGTAAGTGTNDGSGPGNGTGAGFGPAQGSQGGAGPSGGRGQGRAR